MQGYDEHDTARWVDEPPKRSGRTAFVRDRARIVHSAAFRRLAAKTQVVGPASHDFVRNRLTHTLEVAQIGRELGMALGCDPDLVDTACLAHDLGHPPFGHNGEVALDRAAAGCGGFEGNAQTLRILTRLEAKTAHPDGRLVGLNLSRASLDAATKYPWTRREAPPPQDRHGDGTARGVAKFGVYGDDLEVFSWLRHGAPGRRRCLEAQVMDVADDIAYCVHDVEDAVVGGRVDLARLGEPAERAGVRNTTREWYLPAARDDEVDGALNRLQGMSSWPLIRYDGTRQALSALKNLTSDLIGRFCTAAERATRELYGDRPLTRYAADVVIPRRTAVEVAVLKGIAAHYVMRADDRLAEMTRQRELLAELVGHLSDRPDRLEPAFRADHEAASDDAGRLRAVLDQVASLTDASAVIWHADVGGS